MAGFLELAVIAEHFGNAIVNTFAFRSDVWLPLGGDPFQDSQKVMDDFWANCGTEWLATFNANYRVLRLESVVHADNWDILNGSPSVKTINDVGTQTGGALETTGSSVTAILGWNLGLQQQIQGIGKSKRNIAYSAIGPVPEVATDSYGHFVPSYLACVNALAAKLDDTLIDIPLAASFVPIRLHAFFLPKVPGFKRVLVYRTYSDVIGYRLPRVASWRRSRMPEA